MNEATDSHTSWIFSEEEMKNLPSFADAVTPEQEFKYRVETAFFMQSLARVLNVEHHTLATALVFFHRFYMLHSFQKYDRFLIGMTCLFLAGKSEENQMKLSDIMNHGRSLANKLNKQSYVIPEPNTALQQEKRHEMMRLERVLLQTLHFDLTIHHPFKKLREDVNLLQCDRTFLQVAWNFVNDSLRTTVCLQYEPTDISAAAIQLASLYTNVNLGPNWMENKLGLHGKAAVVDSICRQICQLYTGSSNKLILEKFSKYMK